MKKSILFLTLLVTACVNPYAKFYSGMENAKTHPNYIHSTEPIKIYSSNDLKRDYNELRRKGYVLIGESGFTGPANAVSKSQLLEHAQRVGAHIVLTSSEYSHTESGVAPLTLPTTNTSHTTGSATAYGRGGPVTAYGSSTTTTYGSQTTFIPYRVQHGQFRAVYFAKAKQRVGLIPISLDDDTKRQLETNAGVRVEIVVEGSPAFNADILPGDILLSFGGVKVISVDHYTTLLMNHPGSSVVLVLYRNGKQISKSVAVNN